MTSRAAAKDQIPAQSREKRSWGTSEALAGFEGGWGRCDQSLSERPAAARAGRVRWVNLSSSQIAAPVPGLGIGALARASSWAGPAWR